MKGPGASAALPVTRKVDVLVAGGGPAGVAAVISLRENVAPREIDVKSLQDELRKQECIVDAADVEKANARPAGGGG